MDALMLPRKGVQGHLMTLTTRKTGTLIADRPLPRCVIEALQDLSPDRTLARPNYFFWDKKIAPGSLGTKFGKIISAMNQCLSFHTSRTQKTARMNPSSVNFEYGDFPCLRTGSGSDRSDAEPPRLLSEYGD
jgi:hypothetical protein